MKSFIIFTVLGLKTNYITKYNNVISQTTSNRNLMTGGNFPKLFLGMLYNYVSMHAMYPIVFNCIGIIRTLIFQFYVKSILKFSLN